ELFDGSWRLKHMPLRPSSFFGMSAEEIVYWLVQLSGFSAKPPVVPGLSVDKEVRPFIYAVPLIGISASGPVSLSIGDVGVVAGEPDNMFSPLVEALGDISKDLPEWAKQVPKAYGVVLAKSPLEADQMGLKRAQMTADILNFSIR